MTSEERMLMDIYLAKQKEQAEEAAFATVGNRVEFQDLQFEDGTELYSIDGVAILFDSGYPSDIFIHEMHKHDEALDEWVKVESLGLINYYCSYLLEHKEVCEELHKLMVL